jgi:transglutaminase-like putative cysteine protease
MKIRAGYEIAYDCPQPTPMILQVSVHPSRQADLISWDGLKIDPVIPANTYHDTFGNFCHVIRAPAGRLTLSTDFLVQDSGELDEFVPDAMAHPLEELPVDALIFLLGSRYCETDRLSDFAWSTFGHLPKGWGLVQAICDFAHERIKFGYEFASSEKTAFDAFTERRGVCRDYAHLAITLCRSGRFCRLVRGLSRWALVSVRPAQQCAPPRPHPDGARARRDRRRDGDLVRPVHAGEFQGGDRRSGGDRGGGVTSDCAPGRR